jgi:ABC-type amino acid transport substrate-binding protein
MKTKTLVLFFLAATLLQAKETITMVFTKTGYPPFYSKDLKDGMFIDFMKSFQSKHKEFEIKYVSLDRQEMDRWMESGKADAFSLNSPTFAEKGMLRQFTYSEPIWETSDHIITNPKSHFEYTDLKDLEGKTFGLINNNGYGILDALIDSKRVKTVRKKTTKELLDLLLKSKIDAMVGNIHTVSYKLKLNKLPKDTITFSLKAIMNVNLRVQIQKNRKSFKNALNLFIKESKKSRFIKTITQKYID